MANEPRDVWFPAKRYGWGWGPPVKWQGWVVVAAYVAAIVMIVLRFPPHQDLVAFLVLTFATTMAMIGVCWWKGETPRWRSGDRKP